MNLDKIDLFWRNYRHDNRGNFLITFSVSAFALLIGVGTAIEYSNLNKVKTQMLDAAESAAVASASSVPYTDPERRERAKLLFDENFTDNHVPHNNLDMKVALTPIRATVEATADVPLKFLSMSGKKYMPVSVMAAAEMVFEPACVLVTNPTRNQALRLQGHPTLATQDCYVHVNSSSLSSAVSQGNPVTLDTEFCLNGEFQGRRWGITPEVDCGEKADPYLGLPRPGVPACMERNFRTSSREVNTLRPGNYCGGLKFRSNSESVLEPGIYVISDGQFSLDPNATISGDGVVFYLTGDAANFSLSSGANWEVTPPKSGDFKGLSIYQDPSSMPDRRNEIKGGGEMDITGGIYTPSADLRLQGSPELNLTGGGTVLVVNALALQGSPELNVRAVTDPDLMPNAKFAGRFDYVRVVE